MTGELPWPTEVHDDLAALTRAAADRVLAACRDAVARSGRFTVALSGGATPRPLYRLLSADPYAAAIPWPNVHVFFCDERCVPPDHPDSNYGMVRDALLAHVPLPRANVHRMSGESPDAAEAARDYETELLRFFAPREGEPPRLDLVVLGMGADGHTASLFPGSSALAETRRMVAAPFVETQRARRLTLTLPVLNAAHTVLFLVSGSDKADALARVLAEARTPEALGDARADGARDVRLPASRLRMIEGAPVWLVDRRAHGSRLAP